VGFVVDQHPVAFSSVLPSLLLRRPAKGGYDGSGYAGIQANADQLTLMADRSRLADAGIIDPQPVRSEIARLAAGTPATTPGTSWPASRGAWSTSARTWGWT
jgi:hypothetical protein